MQKLLTFLLLGVFALSVMGQSAAPQLGKDPVKKGVAAMTLEEKATLVVGAGRGFAMMGGQQQNAPTGPMVGHTEDLIAGAAGATYGLPRLGITLDINPRDLASFDTSASAWIAEAGTYTIKAGASSEKIMQEDTFSLSRTKTVEKEGVALAPPITINKLSK